MEDEAKLQEKAMKMQMVEQQMMQVQKQLQQLEGQQLDLGITKESLEDLKKTEKGTDMLSMISPGIFVKTELKGTEDVIINVGANVAVKKKLDDAKKMVENQVEEIKNLQMQLMEDMQKLNGTLMNLG